MSTGGVEGSWEVSTGSFCPPLSSNWLSAPSGTLAATAVFWTPPSRSIRTQPLPLSPRTHTLCDYGTCKTSFNIAIPSGGFTGSKNASSAFGFLSSLYQQPASWRLERIGHLLACHALDLEVIFAFIKINFAGVPVAHRCLSEGRRKQRS